MTEPVGVAIVGTGMWGKRIAQAVQRTPSLKLVTCYSRKEEARTAFASTFGCEAADSLDSAIGHQAVQGVLLITPNFAHLEGALACIAQEKHIFLEKPIADSMADAQAIRKAAAESRLTLMIGHAFRRLGAARKVKQLIDQGAIGEVVLAEANFSLPGTLTPEKWRFYRETCPGGPLMQLGVHHADTLQYWLGPVESVNGGFSRMATSAEIDDVGIASLRFASGALGTITGSYVSPKTYWLRLYGTEGNLHYHTDMSIWPNAEQMDSATTLTLIDKSGQQISIDFEARDMLHDQLDEFARCIQGELSPETGSQQALAALSVIRGALESHDTGRAISVEEL